MKNLSQIWLCMENCDVIHLPLENVSLLEFNGIDVLHNEVPADTDHPDVKVIFNIKYEYMSWYNGTEEDRIWYSYLFTVDRYNLVSIDFHYEDGTIDEYYLPWEDGEDDYTNILETLTRLPDGQILIEIHKA